VALSFFPSPSLSFLGLTSSVASHLPSLALALAVSGMATLSRPSKRQRVVQSGTNIVDDDLDLCGLVSAKAWDRAEERVRSKPEEARSSIDPSPLALACRLGAPFACVKAILDACPEKLRHLLDSRGTPLHEAVVCDDAGPQVIELLLKADEELQLGSGNTRATIMQDVDGYTPLHLLIRRRFQSHVLGFDEGSHLMELLEMLVKSCARAVVVPDCGEYEEPPIVMALKANVYAPLLQSEDATAARIERNIHEMVSCMLRHYPSAASCVFKGYRGKYTALHSAVFHGRCSDTIELLLEAEKQYPSSEKAGLLANTQGELPLHFCAMRGEPPRSVALLAEGAPDAVCARDISGLTPVHWLWIRFVSALLAIDDGGRGSSTTTTIETPGHVPVASDKYNTFASVYRGDFEMDLQLIRRLDPSVDFLRMRHIPDEVLDECEAAQWAERTVDVLKYVRERYELSKKGKEQGEGDKFITWSRLEVVSSLFWTKVVSLLKAAFSLDPDSNDTKFRLVQTAFQSKCCPPPVAWIVASLYSEEMLLSDQMGRLPLHHAARRTWHAWDLPRQDDRSESANTQLLHMESSSLVRTALSLSPLEAAMKKDTVGCLPLHYAISTLTRALCANGRSTTENATQSILDIFRAFVQMNPESLQERDPVSGLFPYLHASSVVAEERKKTPSSSFRDEDPLSVVYLLLRENPSIIR